MRECLNTTSKPGKDQKRRSNKSQNKTRENTHNKQERKQKKHKKKETSEKRKYEGIKQPKVRVHWERGLKAHNQKAIALFCFTRLLLGHRLRILAPAECFGEEPRHCRRSLSCCFLFSEKTSLPTAMFFVFPDSFLGFLLAGRASLFVLGRLFVLFFFSWSFFGSVSGPDPTHAYCLVCFVG